MASKQFLIRPEELITDPTALTKSNLFQQFPFNSDKLSNSDVVDISNSSICSTDISDIDSLTTKTKRNKTKRRTVNNYCVKYQLCKHNHQFVTSPHRGLGPNYHGGMDSSEFRNVKEHTLCISPESVEEKVKMPPNFGRVRKSIRRSTLFKKVFA